MVKDEISLLEEELVQLSTQTDALKPLRRGIFISTEVKEKVWTTYVDFSGQRVAEVSFVVEQMATEDNLPILETTVYHQNLRDLVVHLFLEIMEDTVRGELSKEIIEADMQGEWNKMKSQIRPIILVVETCHKTKMASWKCVIRITRGKYQEGANGTGKRKVGIQDPEEVEKQYLNGGNNKKLKIMERNLDYFSVLEIESDLWEQITKIDENRMEKVRKRCGFNYGIKVQVNGSRGGLCLAWKGDVNVQLRSYSNHHIDKVGGVPREELRMKAFRKALDDCQLGDIGYSRNWFPWEQGNLPETNIRELLDKGVTNNDWIKVNRNELKCAGFKKLEDLMAEGQDDDNLAVLIDVKIQLNFELDKDEAFLEQKAIAN
ncbi:hypothetical protein Gotur_023682 [Gossypium turneri]